MGIDATTRDKAREWLNDLEQRWDQLPNAPDESTREFIVSSLRAAILVPASPDPRGDAVLYLERLAHHFSGEDVHFDEPAQIRAFCERLRRSVSLLVEEFQALLAGRKKVQNDWSLHSSTSSGSESGLVTRDIRLGDVHGELGKTLFDWRHPETTDEAITSLKVSLEELKHHQLATMAGYERSVSEGARSLLDSLDPTSVEREYLGISDEKTKGRGGIKRFLPLRGYFLWQAYKKRYSQIASEDARWYQRQFLPAFRQGYRDYMVSRTGAAAKRTPSA